MVILDSTIVGAGPALYLTSGSTAVVGRSTLATTGTQLINVTTFDPTRPNALFIGGSILDARSTWNSLMCSASGPVTSLGWNVTADESCGLTATGDLLGEPGMVAAIARNGGLTRTALLVPGSPAIDHIPSGTQTFCDGAPDQRGAARPQGGGCDAGAVEGVRDELDSVSFVVDTAADGVDTTPGDGICATSGGSCTLRAAVMEANARGGGSESLDHLVIIADGIDPVLSSAGVGEDASATGDLDVLKPLTVDGAGATVDGAGLDRVFDVRSTSLSIRDLTITGGVANGVGADSNGGGIRGDLGSTITLDRAAVVGSSAKFGGGVNSTGRLTVTDSEIAANHADDGGGIHSSGPNLLIERSLLRHNDASSTNGGGDGGALYTTGDNAVIVDSTFSGNTALPGGGAAAISTEWSFGDVSEVMLVRSTVVDNVGAWAVTLSGTACVPLGCAEVYLLKAVGSILVGSPGSPACRGTLLGTAATLGNLAPDGTCGFTLPGDPLLGPLVDAGGPTLVHVPAAGSSAIDAIAPGSLSSCTSPSLDQRGVSRPQGSGCDVGAVEQ